MKGLELGAIVRDRITGFKGMALNRIEYMTGCIRWEVEPTEEKKEGGLKDGYSFDEKRLEVVKKADSFKRAPVKFKLELGSEVREKLTGFAGTVVARCHDIFDNVKVCIKSGSLHEGKPIEPQWFDDQTVDLVRAAAPYRSVHSVATTGGPATRRYQER